VKLKKWKPSAFSLSALQPFITSRIMIKLVVTDVDGTLLDDNKNLSPDFWDTIAALTRKNIIFSVASGRQYYTLARQFARIAAGTLFLAENGTYVSYKNRELFTNALDLAAARNFIKIGRTITGAYPILCGKNSAYVENDNEQFILESSRFYEKYQRVNDLTKVEDTILKVTLFDFHDAEKHAYLRFKQYEHQYKIAPAGKRWVDITAPTASKGSALRRVQGLLGISPDETLVFGDYLNDLEMMREAKYSHAMKNAHPEIIKAANYITEHDNNHHGVTRTIRKLCLGHD
jgi:Cof subfamily protein (haloacid dehalogenase superfamily)